MSASTIRRPLIGLPGRRKKMGDIAGFPENLAELDGDLYFSDYARSVWEAGGMPVHLPIDVDYAEWAQYLDGIVFSGGADIEPSLYGHENTDSTVEATRDANEFDLYRVGAAAGLPMLGICRGFQLINVANGGTLHQDVPSHANYVDPPADPAHEVTFEPGSILYDLYGPRLKTNTLHHQTVDRVGDGVRITATAADGTPEGLEVIGAPIIAVQWHPEMMHRDTTAFKWLVQAATGEPAQR